MSTYQAVLFTHVLAAILLVGNSFLAPVIRNLTSEAASAEALIRALDLERRTTRWNPPVALVLLASGVYLGSGGWWTEPWFHVSVLAWVANSLLASLVIRRVIGALRQSAAEVAGPGGQPIDRLSGWRRWSLSLAFMMGNDVGVLYLMIGKPGWAGSMAVLVATNLAAVAMLTRERPQPGGPVPGVSGVRAV